MRTFKDLKFEQHSIAKSGLKQYASCKQAIEKFNNGYEVSVLFGNAFYSNGIDTYELAILKDGNLCYSTDITNDVVGYIKEEEVSDIMIKVQSL